MSHVSFSAPALLAALCLASAAVTPVAAQQATVYYSTPYSLSRGNSNAGATLYGSAYVYGHKRHTTLSTARRYFGDARASITGRLAAKFLGTSRTVAHSSASIRAYGTFTFRNGSTGWPDISCNQYGNLYLRLGGTTLYNHSFRDNFKRRVRMTLRIVSPTLTVFAGAPVLLRGRLNGSIDTSVDLRIFGCHFSAKLNGEAAASASGSASATMLAPVIGGATVSFRVNRQALCANVSAQPPVVNTWTSPSSWLRGLVQYKRGWMGATIKAWAYVPWKVSKTIARWSLGSATRTLFNR